MAHLQLEDCRRGPRALITREKLWS